MNQSRLNVNTVQIAKAPQPNKYVVRIEISGSPPILVKFTGEDCQIKAELVKSTLEQKIDEKKVAEDSLDQEQLLRIV